MIKKSFLIVALLLHSMCFASSEFDLWMFRGVPKTSFELFAAQHAPPKRIRDIVESNKDALAEMVLSRSVQSIQSSDGKTKLFIKPGIERIIYADKMQQFLERHTLDRLGVADKYLLPVKDAFGRTWWTVIAQGVPEGPSFADKKITLEEVKQLVKVTDELGYVDMHSGNVGRSSEDNKIYYIDTERRSFCPDQLRAYVQGLEFKGALSSNCFEPEAWEWLKKREQVLHAFVARPMNCTITPEKFSHTIDTQFNDRMNARGEVIDYDEVYETWLLLNGLHILSK